MINSHLGDLAENAHIENHITILEKSNSKINNKNDDNLKPIKNFFKAVVDFMIETAHAVVQFFK